MKKIQVILGLFALLGLVFPLPSCDKDGDWSNAKNEDIYGFAIERDVEFAEKALKEVTPIMFNVKANYDFDKIPMKFKVLYMSGAGTLTLNGVVIENNSTYKLKKKDNTFEYVGTKEGKNSFVITATNDKNVSKEEEFNINYAVTDFSVESKPVNQNQTIWQGDEYSYNIKIEPRNSSKPANDYHIMFEVYDGDIKLESRNVQKGVWYKITGDIGNIGVTMKTNTSGNAILRFKIKNNTTERDGFSITQKIEQRRVEFKNLSISDTSFVKGSDKDYKIWGNIIKTPKTNNNRIFYKAWLNAPADYTGGIDEVKEYQEYALTENGGFNMNFNVTNKATIGTYSFFIQFKDEYGNESEVKTFDFKVINGKFTWVTNPQATAFFDRWKAGVFNKLRHFSFAFFESTFEIYSGRPNLYITKINYKVKYQVKCYKNSRFQNITYEHGYNVYDGHNGKFIEIISNNQTTVKHLKVSHDFENINHGGDMTWVEIEKAWMYIMIELSNGQTIHKDWFEIGVVTRGASN